MVSCTTSPLRVREIQISEVRLEQNIRVTDEMGAKREFKVERITNEKIFGRKRSVNKNDIAKLEVLVGGDVDMEETGAVGGLLLNIYSFFFFFDIFD